MICDLELWLIGTPGQLNRAITALTAVGRVVQPGTRQQLTGADAGRARQYLRIAVIAKTAPVPRPRLRLVNGRLDAAT